MDPPPAVRQTLNQAGVHQKSGEQMLAMQQWWLRQVDIIRIHYPRVPIVMAQSVLAAWPGGAMYHERNVCWLAVVSPVQGVVLHQYMLLPVKEMK